METKSLKSLLNNAKQYIKYDKPLGTTIIELKQAKLTTKWTKYTDLNRTAECVLLATVVDQSKPSALKELLAGIPNILGKNNAEWFFFRIVDNLSAENVDTSIELYNLGAAHTPVIGDLQHILKGTLYNTPHCIKFFDGILSNVNLLARGKKNKCVLQLLCGETQEMLKPRHRHLAAILEKGGKRIKDKLDGFMAPLDKMRSRGEKKGAYGASLLELAHAVIPNTNPFEVDAWAAWNAGKITRTTGWITSDGVYVLGKLTNLDWEKDEKYTPMVSNNNPNYPIYSFISDRVKIAEAYEPSNEYEEDAGALYQCIEEDAENLAMSLGWQKLSYVKGIRLEKSPKSTVCCNLGTAQDIAYIAEYAGLQDGTNPAEIIQSDYTIATCADSSLLPNAIQLNDIQLPSKALGVIIAMEKGQDISVSELTALNRHSTILHALARYDLLPKLGHVAGVITWENLMVKNAYKETVLEGIIERDKLDNYLSYDFSGASVEFEKLVGEEWLKTNAELISAMKDELAISTESNGLDIF